MRNYSLRIAAGRATRGFSLVEVTLAVAIAALAIITLLGLLPQGLEMSRKTAQLTNNSNILEQVVRDLENSDFAIVQTMTGASEGVRFYFNDQGLKVGSESDDIAYVALVTVESKSPLPKTNDTQNYLRRVVVKVATTANSKYKFDSSKSNLGYSTFYHLIAKTH